MKFNCSKNDLIQALQIAGRAVATKPQTPILSGIYMKASEGTLELQATDYEIGVVCKIDADVDEEGILVAPGRYFSEVSRNLPGNTVTLTNDNNDNTIHISSGSAHFTLLKMNSEEFPCIRPLNNASHFTIRDTVLKKLIRKTSFACANDETRLIFTGCLLELEEEAVRMAATNTHRLSLDQEVLEGYEGDKKQVIIPARILGELEHGLNSDIPCDVTVNISYNEISFSFENLYLTSRLIEGQFPDYHRVIPSDFKTRVTIDTAAFMAAVNRVSLIARSSEYNIVKLDFSMGQVHISSNSPEIGHAEETVPVVIDGPDVQIAFNGTYITDVLKHVDTKEFYLSLNESLNPAAVRETEDEAFIYIVTPVRVSR